ncbi:MAG: dihydrofolate reductase family protein [Brevinema sp.]
MNNRLVYYVACSLDGFIADKNGSVDWLEQIQIPSTNDNSFEEFFSQVGIILMGGTTYRQVLSFGIDWPYQGVPCYVFTHHPSPNHENIFFVNGNIEEIVSSLPSLPKDKIIWLVGGYNLASQCWGNNLINELHLAQAPIVLGEGTPLFPKKVPSMKLIEAKKIGEFVFSRYAFNH